MQADAEGGVRVKRKVALLEKLRELLMHGHVHHQVAGGHLILVELALRALNVR